jgi:hypothetical protein
MTADAIDRPRRVVVATSYPSPGRLDRPSRLRERLHARRAAA